MASAKESLNASRGCDVPMWSTRHRLLPQSSRPLSAHYRTCQIRRASTSVVLSSRHQCSSVLREKLCHEFTAASWTSYHTTARWVCLAGGKRPRRPRIFKTRQRRGAFSKSDKLLECIDSLSTNVKEEVYGALDTFIAWDLDFPLVPVKKALYVLEKRGQWARIIQVIKWMLGKGQGQSYSTYQLLLRAFSVEGRIDEAEEVFKKIFERNLECTPVRFFVEIMRLYQRYGMHDHIIDVFADMEELNVKLNDELTDIVSQTYETLGFMDKAEKVRLKYAPPKFRWRTVNGRAVKFYNHKLKLSTEVSRSVKAEGSHAADKDEAYGGSKLNENRLHGGIDGGWEDTSQDSQGARGFYVGGLGEEMLDEQSHGDAHQRSEYIEFLDSFERDWSAVGFHDSFEDEEWRYYGIVDDEELKDYRIGDEDDFQLDAVGEDYRVGIGDASAHSSQMARNEIYRVF